MKRIGLLFIAVLLSQNLFAQKGFKIGLKFTPIYSWVKITVNDEEPKDTTYSGKIGFSYGLLFNYGFTDNYAVHLGIHIVYRGFGANWSIGSEAYSEGITLTTLEFPLALKLRSNEFGNGMAIKGLFGGSLDLNIGAKSKPSGSKKADVYDQYNLIDMLFLIGAGLEWEPGNFGRFDMGISFHQGLMNQYYQNWVKAEIIDQNGNTVEIKPHENAIAKISYIALDLGYYF